MNPMYYAPPPWWFFGPNEGSDLLPAFGVICSILCGICCAIYLWRYVTRLAKSAFSFVRKKLRFIRYSGYRGKPGDLFIDDFGEEIYFVGGSPETGVFYTKGINGYWLFRDHPTEWERRFRCSGLVYARKVGMETPAARIFHEEVGRSKVENLLHIDDPRHPNGQ